MPSHPGSIRFDPLGYSMWKKKEVMMKKKKVPRYWTLKHKDVMRPSQQQPPPHSLLHAGSVLCWSKQIEFRPEERLPDLLLLLHTWPFFFFSSSFGNHNNWKHLGAVKYPVRLGLDSGVISWRATTTTTTTREASAAQQEVILYDGRENPWQRHVLKKNIPLNHMKIFIHCRDLTLLLVAQYSSARVSGMIGHYFQMGIFLNYYY